MRKRILLFLLILLSIYSYGQSFIEIPYFQNDTGKLYMSLFKAHAVCNSLDSARPTIMYIYGGAFMSGSRLDSSTIEYCQKLQQVGYNVVAIDYRLGMKNKDKLRGMAFVREMKKSIDMAVEDCTNAVYYLINKGEQYGIDGNNIVLIGSSAGAITALQTDYYHCNNNSITSKLGPDYRFAGVVAYAGAIFSSNGKLKYLSHSPAPTLMHHGTDDKIVIYNKIRIGRLGFYGSNAIAKCFKTNQYPFIIWRYYKQAHEVCWYMSKTIPFTQLFIYNYTYKYNNAAMDIFYDNHDFDMNNIFNMNIEDFR